MADTTETPPTAPKKPAAPAARRRAPRKDAVPKPTPKPTAPPAPAAPAAAMRSPAPKVPKPRSTKRATPKPARKSAAASSTKSLITRATDKVGGKWGATAIAGGIAGIGAVAAAALLALRGSARKVTTSDDGAHTADGQDASKSFAAGIADENTIPDKA